MDAKVLELLKDRANIIAYWVINGRHLPEGRSDFTNHMDITEIGRPEDGVIQFNFGRYAKIKFSMIQPAKVISTVLHKPEPTNREVVDASTKIVDNQSEAVLETSYDFKTGETRTWNEDIGVAIETGLSQKISYGGAASPVSGETEFHLNINTSINKSKGGSSSIAREASTSVEVPPYTKMHITANTSKANYTQRIDVLGTLEHDIYIESHNDFKMLFKSWEGFRQLLVGEANDNVYVWAGGSDNEYKNLAPRYRREPEHGKLRGYVNAQKTINYTHTTSFSDAVVGDVTVTSEPTSNRPSAE